MNTEAIRELVITALYLQANLEDRMGDFPGNHVASSIIAKYGYLLPDFPNGPAFLDECSAFPYREVQSLPLTPEQAQRLGDLEAMLNQKIQAIERRIAEIDQRVPKPSKVWGWFRKSK